MTTSLDTIRYHSGIAGEEVADMVDSLEQEVSTLREQVEKLTKEGIEYREKWLSEQSRNLSEEAEFEILSQQVVALEYLSVVDTAAIENLHEQLAALSEQNEKMRSALTDAMGWNWLDEDVPPEIGKQIDDAFALQNLATPVLNRIKAEAYREAAEIVGPEDSYQDDWFKAKADSCAKLRAQADELEKQNG